MAQNFAYQAVEHLIARKKMRLPSDQGGNPTLAGDIAAWTVHVMRGGETGIWNVASPWTDVGRIDWFRGIAGSLMDAGIIEGKEQDWFEAQPTSSLGQRALRPLRASADVTKLRAVVHGSTRHYTNIRDILADIQAGHGRPAETAL